MTQQTLFPLVRSTDPATSQAGALGIAQKLPSLKARILTVSSNVPKTACELARLAVEQFGGREESYRKRVRELCRDGLLVECDARKCGVTGKDAATFRK